MFYDAISSLSFLDGSIGVTLTQSPSSTTRTVGTTARMKCVFTNFTGAFASAAIHWYQQSPGEAPKRVLYFISGDAASNKNVYSLTIDDISSDDAAMYYCASWDDSTYNKIFGSGTKLVVTSKYLISTPTAQGEMLHHVEDSKETYVCLVHNFFPNVIRMYWEDKEGKKISDNVVQGEVWPPREDADSYSVSSWLTVNKDSNKEYICQYEREGSVKQSVHTQLPTGISYIAKTVYIV
uniref:Ig-like domain-containing protein n=1 Tax=Crocodylus porosus TaxID=8502 RepID=A0A7M4EWS5_CROPO